MYVLILVFIFFKVLDSLFYMYFISPGLPNMDSRDVEEIFKGVLTDESQESQDCNVFPMSTVSGQVLSAHSSVSVSPSPSQHNGI